jgi:hypothetical protein
MKEVQAERFNADTRMMKTLIAMRMDDFRDIGMLLI